MHRLGEFKVDEMLLMIISSFIALFSITVKTLHLLGVSLRDQISNEMRRTAKITDVAR